MGATMDQKDLEALRVAAGSPEPVAVDLADLRDLLAVADEYDRRARKVSRPGHLTIVGVGS